MPGAVRPAQENRGARRGCRPQEPIL